jgi:hypothetical protein
MWGETMSALRPELEELPIRMLGLPVDERGYPVPWFVDWIEKDGVRVPEFRAIDRKKVYQAIGERRCWVCGGILGVNLAFVVGPMCGVNRISSEPPSHLQCAEWSARNCPFLSRPHMRRREDDVLNNETLIQQSKGLSITRNPGVTLVWVTRSYVLNKDQGRLPLFRMDLAENVSWWAEGRPATREQVLASVESGLPLLEEVAKKEGKEAMESVAVGLANLVPLYPPAPQEELLPSKV